ncbi:MAG TPA: ATP-binding protein [Bryobacteraceae bacterium]|nr:ATP-binding protein [Bryobacteraceae bacterium]
MKARLLAPLKKTRWRVVLIALNVVVLASLPWFIPASHFQIHNVLHHLNFIPLMVAGMLYGWRGAILCMLFADLVYAPHLYVNWNVNRFDASDQIVEISIFGGAGVIAGLLADRERRQRFNLEKTKRELENVYTELQQNIERLKKGERLYAAGQLSANLAHEIRNPLASISGAAGILRRGNASPENIENCLEIIDKEAHRLNKLLTSFLDFARPRAPRFQFTDLGSLAASVVSLAAHATSSRDVHLYQEFDGRLPEVECDPEQMKQVLLNLTINAIQASASGGTVWLTGKASADRVCVSIRDEGCGVSAEHEDQIFDPFFTTKDSGSGLGLAIASMIVAQHGGLLTAHKNTGPGMTFQLELPRDRNRPI